MLVSIFFSHGYHVVSFFYFVLDKRNATSIVFEFFAGSLELARPILEKRHR